MVKKIATLCLFLGLIATAILQYFYIRNSSRDFAGIGEEARVFAEGDDMDSASRNIQVLDKKWTEKKDSFEALMEHSETDKISMSMEKCVSFAAQKDKVQFLAELNVLLFLLEHIHEIDSFSWENIL